MSTGSRLNTTGGGLSYMRRTRRAEGLEHVRRRASAAGLSWAVQSTSRKSVKYLFGIYGPLKLVV
jgi:hypothetical protein